MKIVLDFDGTIYSTAKRMIDIVKVHYPESYKGGTFKDIKEYGFKPVLDISDEKVQEMFNRKDFYTPEYIMDGSLEFIEKFQSLGNEVEILTVGKTYNNANKSLLLDSLGISIVLNKIDYIGNKKLNMNKGSYHANYKGYTVYVDDRKECLDTVKGFGTKIQFSEDGYILEEDKNDKYSVVENWDNLEKIVSDLSHKEFFEEVVV